MAKKKQEFVSNVTGEEWFKHNTQRWTTVINQVGIIMEDEIHDGKNGEKITLKKGSRVIIDDIRGRIKPQYRVIDTNGKVWFVSALNVEFSHDEKRESEVKTHRYHGGVRVDKGSRHDGTELSPRYTVDKTTEEEYIEAKEKEKLDNA
tara:strand:- start:75 stop:518 length:444 start_codon:yes stop_codon:yes gene_type:complete